MVKNEFGIKDLENLSKVKAHTIRMWEKRYNLLEPDRTTTNIRKYSLENLKRLLNIVYLYDSGYKISKLAKMTSSEIQDIITNNLDSLDQNYPLQILKTTMFDFNSELFDATFEKLLEERNFEQIFEELFIPLLTELGVLWHAGTIDPSHEHFLSELVKHKIIFQSEDAKKVSKIENSPTFVLYLPHEEIHEIGLLFANYKLLNRGYKTIYLGPNTAIESLQHIGNNRENIIYLTSFTVQPETNSIKTYLKEFKNTLNKNNDSKLWIMGNPNKTLLKLPPNMQFFTSIQEFNNTLDNLKKA